MSLIFATRISALIHESCEWHGGWCLLSLVGDHGEEGDDEKTTRTGRVKATLIICPVNVLAHWVNEFETKCTGKNRLYVYRGAKRKVDLEELKLFDAVLTSYHDIRPGPNFDALQQCHFFRVVLDESQSVAFKISI